MIAHLAAAAALSAHLASGGYPGRSAWICTPAGAGQTSTCFKRKRMGGPAGRAGLCRLRAKGSRRRHC